MNPVETVHRESLVRIVRETPWLMDALEVVREFAPPQWCIAAGAIRSTVWNQLTGRVARGPESDIDVAYFDAGHDCAADYGRQLSLRRSAHLWEVTNQATVHRWHEEMCGRRVPALASMEDGLATWPETATAVGVRLESSGDLVVFAPFGLDNLFSMTVRHNAALAGADVYGRRILEKKWRLKWPAIRVLPPDDASKLRPFLQRGG